MDLKRVDLIEVNLNQAIFDEDQIGYLKDKYDLQCARVLINENGEIMNYEEYCNRK